MTSRTAAAFLLFATFALSLGSVTLRALSSRKALPGRLLPFIFFNVALAVFACVAGVFGVLASTRDSHSLALGHTIGLAGLEILAGCITLYLAQEQSLLRNLILAFPLYTPHRVRAVVLLLAPLLLTSTALAISYVAREWSDIPNISPIFLIIFLAIASLLVSSLLVARQMQSDLRLRLMWSILLMGQMCGILSAAIRFDAPTGVIIQALFTVVWLACGIIALHLFTLSSPPARLSSPVQFERSNIFLQVPGTHSANSLDRSNSRVRHPSSPITPTEEYLRVQDPFASPPCSSLSHCSTFDEHDLEKLVRHSPHGNTFSDTGLPTLYIRNSSLPHRGLASVPLPTFPRELMLAAREARDSSRSSTYDVKTLVDPLCYHALEKKDAEPEWKS